MQNQLNRRAFIKNTALAAGAISAGSFLPGCETAKAPMVTGPMHKPGDKLNCVQIGCGGRAFNHLDQVIDHHGQNLFAIVDPDENKHAGVRAWLKKKKIKDEKLQVFTDYRVMFDKIGKDIDAVFITTPNHHHATAAMMAMQRGINVYCEKPLCHDIAEARRLREMAAQCKVATQMGNQGHCMEGYHRLCEFIWGGVIGKVTETHSWTNRANGGEGPRPPVLPVPAGLHWEEWIGPAPYRDFHSDLHPHEWHGWYDFGNGSIGNMGCHVLDGVFWALKVGHPTSIEMEEVRGGSNERYPMGSRIRWDIPARGDMPALKAYWYEGLNRVTKDDASGVLRATKGTSRNLPTLFYELQNLYPEEDFDTSGTFFVGEKGIIFTGTYGNLFHMVPREQQAEMTLPPKTLVRPEKEDIFLDFIKTVKAGRTDTYVPFEYGARLTEFAILGNLAQHAGLGNKIEWDGPNMKVKNIPALNAWVKREPRKGWQV